MSPQKKRVDNQSAFTLMSIAAIVIDPNRLQSRVTTDLEHVRRMVESLQTGWTAENVPVHVFEVEPGKYYLVDGFHRVAAFKKLGRTAIPAIVHQGTMSDAIAFAASANLENLGLTITMEDKKKAARMLLEDKELFVMSDAVLAKTCGMSESSFNRFRILYCQEHNLMRPMEVLGSNGKWTFAPNASRVDRVPRVDRTGRHRMWIHGKSVFLGRTPETAKAKLDALLSAEKSIRPSIMKVGHICNWLARRNVFVRTNSITAARNLPTDRFASFSLPIALVRIEAAISPRNLAAAVGDVLLWRQSVDPKLRAIVLCYPDGDDVQEGIRLARELGVEFMTPEQVVDEFAGKGWPEGATPPLAPPSEPGPSSSPP